MSDYLSSIVSPAYRRIVGSLTDLEQQNQSFSVYDKLNNNYMLFIPKTAGNDSAQVLVYTFNQRLKMHAWSTFEGLEYKAAWTSILGRAFFAQGTRIYLGGNDTFTGENFYADKLRDRDYTYAPSRPMFNVGDLVLDSATQEIWKCVVAHAGSTYATFQLERELNPGMWVEYHGVPIKIEMELPWIDGKDPTKLKQLRFVSVATKGDGEFTFQAYVDNLYKDVDGELLTIRNPDPDSPDLYVPIKPAVEMAFIGNDAFGYGYDDGPDGIDGAYGMGRRSRDPRLFGVPVKFKSVKFKIVGETQKKLELVNLSFLFAKGK
jgi:hypothetical protein